MRSWTTSSCSKPAEEGEERGVGTLEVARGRPRCKETPAGPSVRRTRILRRCSGTQ
jgi:hypothetical protein